jgi:hypothetical protein
MSADDQALRMYVDEYQLRELQQQLQQQQQQQQQATISRKSSI